VFEVDKRFQGFLDQFRGPVIKESRIPYSEAVLEVRQTTA